MSAQQQGHQHHGHQHHGHGHGHVPAADLDWDALAAHLELEADLRAEAVTEAGRWLSGLAGDGAVRRVLDVGAGPGVIAGLLAEVFPAAEVVAVDQSAALLERARARAGGRLGTQQADLPAEFDKLGEADLIWSGNAIHHLGDQQAALTALAGRLRSGGLLAVAESGLPARYLPRDFGLGRPGFQARLDAVHEDASPRCAPNCPAPPRRSRTGRPCCGGPDWSPAAPAPSWSTTRRRWPGRSASTCAPSSHGATTSSPRCSTRRTGRLWRH